MGEIAVGESQPASRWILRTLYALLFVCGVALVLLVLGDIVYSFEEGHEDHEHEHGFYAPIFDGAWVVFLPTFAVSAIAGVVALLAGVFRRARAFTTYGIRALVFCVACIAVLLVAESVG